MVTRKIRIAASALLLAGTGLSGVGLTATSADATYAGHDGKIAFVRHNQIYTMTGTGRHVTKLTSSGKNYRPHWSPGGKRIAYIHETTDGARNLWVMGASGRHKTAVTRSGEISSAGAAWSPSGSKLAFAAPNAAVGQALYLIKSTAPFGRAHAPHANPADDETCGNGDDFGNGPVPVDRYLAWSADDVIAVFNHDSLCPDDAMWMFHPATGEYDQYLVTGGECCGEDVWTDLFFGPTSKFGYTDLDEQAPDPQTQVVYPDFASRDGDAGASPSPSRRYVALTNHASQPAHVYRAWRDGTHRKLLAVGYQPDWQRQP